MVDNIKKLIGLSDNENPFIMNVGQGLIFDAVERSLEQHAAELAASLGVFVEMETEKFQEKYKFRGGGKMQTMREFAAPKSTIGKGQYTVGYPLDVFQEGLGGSRRGLASMTVEEFQIHIDTILEMDIETVRFNLLKALLNNTNDIVDGDDSTDGTITVKPLANGDTDKYPPIIGATIQAIEDHYSGTNFVASAISDANNPYVTASQELEEHFGQPQGFGNIVTFINGDQVDKTNDLTDFVSVEDMGIVEGDDTPLTDGFPASMPGRTIGRIRGTGVWVVQWDFVPSGYLISTDLDTVPPLKMRVDRENTGLPTGMNLVSTHDHFPLQNSYYEHAYGFGAGNRLNGVVQQLVASTTYTIPAGFS